MTGFTTAQWAINISAILRRRIDTNGSLQLPDKRPSSTAERVHLEDALHLALHRLADGDALAGAQQQREADVVAPPPQQDPAGTRDGLSRCVEEQLQNSDPCEHPHNYTASCCSTMPTDLRRCLPLPVCPFGNTS